MRLCLLGLGLALSHASSETAEFAVNEMVLSQQASVTSAASVGERRGGDSGGGSCVRSA